MAEILFVRQTPIRLFYWRRASRILPALWCFLAIMVLCHGSSLQGSGVTDALKAGMFVSNFHPTTIAAPLTHLWSLCVEEHSYILLSIIALLARSYRFDVKIVLLGIALVGMINGAVQFFAGSENVYYHTDARLASIFMSAFFYLYFIDKPANKFVPILAGIAGSAIFLLNFPPNAVRFTVGTTLLCVSVTTIDVAWTPMRNVFSNKALRYLGIWSFSLYLVQQPFFLLAGGQPNLRPLWITFTLVWAMASFYLIEKPVRTLLNEIYLRWHSPQTATVERCETSKSSATLTIVTPVAIRKPPRSSI